jgi:hypothetical protein
MIQPFSIGHLPRIEFGAGRISLLPGIAAGFGQRMPGQRCGKAWLKSAVIGST